jgi:hypothetical protein
LAYRTEQVYGLAAVMFQAAQVEDNTVHEVSEKVARLEFENRRLREVLQFSYSVMSSGDSSADSEDRTPTN